MMIKKIIKKPLQQIKYYGFNRLVFSSGMPRSGSTLLFNIVRLVMTDQYGGDLSIGWVEDLKKIHKGRAYLIKTHGCDMFDRMRADKIFYSFRDLRDVMVSRWRKFNREPSMDIARYYIRQYEFARKHADLLFKYEDFVHNVPVTIEMVSKILKHQVDVEAVQKKMPDMNRATAYGSTLMHPAHATGTEKNEWKVVLPIEFQKRIQKEFSTWFEKNGYEC